MVPSHRSWHYLLNHDRAISERNFVKPILNDYGTRITSSFKLHGMFSMIKSDRPLSLHPTGRCFLCELFSLLYIILLSHTEYNEIAILARQRSYLDRSLPSSVLVTSLTSPTSSDVELKIKKEKTMTRAGQYIFLSCTEVSYFQWHPSGNLVYSILSCYMC